MPRLCRPPDSAEASKYTTHPDLAELRVSPIKLDGSVDAGYVISKKGLLFSIRTKRVGRPRSIDWMATCIELGDRELEHIQSHVNDDIERIQRRTFLISPR